jgi:hypothetical protein
VEGTIVERGTGKPVAGVAVSLPSTPYHAVTGTDGTFRIPDVFPGVYAVAAVDSAWEPFDLGRPFKAQVRAQADRVTPAKLEIESLAKLTQDRCGLMGSGVGPSMLAGRVVYAGGSPAHASVVLTSGAETTKQKTTTGGMFWSCGLSPSTVTFTATDDAGAKGIAHITLVSTNVNQLTITIPR